ncbi:general stress protein [Brachybacterium aquaticum]|uniref:General stress protein 17M-like domain-containing protein n=1 Tax=Brachybacterium aquaticum TaxID=1432564 RepID=A0A841A644_9MICO|nr:general stress protein [Brachybacterium aquaticum]MBB5830629.1 hypothetical protein [Brachybacterium aquaticum]
MSQPPQSQQPASPLTARLYDLEYPRSLGVYSTYQEVQSVVDTLADHEFPVQSTLIVGTDLKLMERVTGRRTWPKVIGQGALSGLWMGLFLGLLLLLLSPGSMMIVLSSIVMGIVFFTVWAVIGYAMTGGKRDFTSMTATIPMQYELLVEHKHADQARRILAESGAAPAVRTPVGVPGAQPGAAGQYGAGGQHGTGGQFGTSGQYGGAPQGHPQHGAQQHGAAPQGGQYGAQPTGQYGASVPSDSAPSEQYGYGGQQQAPSQRAPHQSFGQPAAQGPGTADSSSQRSPRPSFGQPAGTPLREDSRPASAADSAQGGSEGAGIDSSSADGAADGRSAEGDQER